MMLLIGNRAERAYMEGIRRGCLFLFMGFSLLSMKRVSHKGEMSHAKQKNTCYVSGREELIEKNHLPD